MSLLVRRARLAAPTRFLARSASSAGSSVPAPRLDPNDPTPRDAAPGQSPNVATPWSRNQNPKPQAWDNPRFEQMDVPTQPDSLSAMGLVNEQPVAMVHARIAVCDGGGGALGHPKIFINLDQGVPKTCGYCGARFQQEHDH